MEEERNFKGIWIPKEIWLNKDLTLQEKTLIAEIDSLDNEEGCFASNKYFGNFFGIAESNISRLITRLKNKGWITIEYDKVGRQIVRRIIKISRPPYPIIKMIGGYYQNDKGVLSNRQEGYCKIVKDNNIYINNIKENIYIEQNEKTLKYNFDLIWEDYPRKKGKTKAYEYYKGFIKGRTIGKTVVRLTNDEIDAAVSKYAEEVKYTEEKYIKQGDTFFNKAILDYVENKE